MKLVAGKGHIVKGKLDCEGEWLTSEQWSMVEAEFAAANEQPPALWPARLAAIKDVRVREEVASLLQHAGAGAETLGSVIGGVSAELLDGNVRERRIGPFRIVRRLGMSGQGAAFGAVRDDGSFQQRVAIKIVKWEIDSPAARLQFRREWQILAGLAPQYRTASGRRRNRGRHSLHCYGAHRWRRPHH